MGSKTKLAIADPARCQLYSFFCEIERMLARIHNEQCRKQCTTISRLIVNADKHKHGRLITDYEYSERRTRAGKRRTRPFTWSGAGTTVRNCDDTRLLLSRAAPRLFIYYTHFQVGKKNRKDNTAARALSASATMAQFQ
jgi:hypothetical protein